MKNVYTITGATGYIGNQLLKHLAMSDDNYIYAIIRKGSKIRFASDNVEYVIFDGTEKSIEYEIENSDYLIHLAALYDTRNDEETTKNLIDSNILFSTTLFNVANRVNKDIVIASASTFSSLDGEGAYAPATLYAATKSAVEIIAKYYSDLSVHFLTFPDTYGPKDWRNKIHNILVKNEKWPFEFRSSSKQQIMLLHVEDVIGHILASLEIKDKGVHIHDIYSSGTLLTLKELSEEITDKECLFNETADLIEIPLFPRKQSTLTGYVEKHTKESISKTLNN